MTEALEALGYPVVAVNSARTPFPRTTIFYVDGWEAEAEALRARDSASARSPRTRTSRPRSLCTSRSARTGTEEPPTADLLLAWRSLRKWAFR